MSLKGKTYYTELSRLSGVPAATISKIARGVDTNPSYKTLEILAHNAFNMSLPRLIDPADDFADDHIILRQRVKTGDELLILTLSKV